VKTYLLGLLQNVDADYAEVRLEESETTRIDYRGPHLENASQGIAHGGNFRVLVNGGWGFVSFTSLDELESKLDLAVRQARLIGSRTAEKSRLADVPVVEDYVEVHLESDPRKVSLADKVELFGDYNRLILDYNDVVQSSMVAYSDRFSKLTFASSEGTYIEQEKLDLSGLLIALASRRGETQQGAHTFGSSTSYGVALALEEHVKEACELATRLLDAPVVEGGEYTVVLDPVMAGVFVHEAFGHLSEADFIYENPNMRETMQLGREFGQPVLNIYDTGLTRGARGYLHYDDEGVLAEKTWLIREGKLVGRLHSRETAAKLGEQPTGNARAINYRYPPIVRMRNTSIEPGDASFADMLSDVELGLYARDATGGETNGEMFSFNARETYMIRDGKLAELVKNASLIGNVFSTLRNIDMVGAELGTQDGAGGCGKGEQSPLPTSQWSPHIRIQRAVIGGRS